jgi:hypothetical protein
MGLKVHSQLVEVLTKTCADMVYFVAVQGEIFCTHVARDNNGRNTLRVTILYNVTNLLNGPSIFIAFARGKGLPEGAYSCLSWKRFSCAVDD